MAFEGISKGESVALASETGDDGALGDQTACLTDDSTGASCVEVKAGVGIRFEWPHNPGAMTSATLKIGVNSIMAAGTLRIAPYSDGNSIDNTNGKTTVSIGAGGDFDESLAQALVDDCLLTIFTLRLFENGSAAKIKVGELDVEATIATIDLTGVTKDKDGVALGSCGCNLLRRVGSFPYTFNFVDNLTSHATTGAYTFSYEDDSGNYMVYSVKDNTPHVFDATDHVLQGA